MTVTKVLHNENSNYNNYNENQKDREMFQYNNRAKQWRKLSTKFFLRTEEKKATRNDIHELAFWLLISIF